MVRVPRQHGFLTAKASVSTNTEPKHVSVCLHTAGIHFKAIPTQPSSCAQREAQATLIAQMVAVDLAAGREVVVTGDFNDFSAEESDRDVQGNVRNGPLLVSRLAEHTGANCFTLTLLGAGSDKQCCEDPARC